MSVTGLGKITLAEMKFISAVTEGFLYGLYSAIFCIYIQYNASNELAIDKKSILIYALCILYILSTATFVLDTFATIATQVSTTLSPNKSNLFRSQTFIYISITVNALCDFISQGILIYRCWVIWGRNIRVIIIPSILSLAFLATWLAIDGSLFYVPLLDSETTFWGYILGITTLGISLTVNAAVTGLIVLKILKVYMEAKPTHRAFEYQTLGNNGAKLRSIMLIIFESGMAMFTIQLIRVVLTILQNHAFYILITINQMFNGITPTIILLRVRMGLSFYDQQSMEETIESLRFQPASQDENPISEPGDIEIAPGQDRVDCIAIQTGVDMETALSQERVDCIGIQTSDDIEIVDRFPI